MLFTIAAVLFLVWLVALFLHVTVWFIHIALIVAVVLFLVGFFTRGARATRV